jgi:hypothetical protein
MFDRVGKTYLQKGWWQFARARRLSRALCHLQLRWLRAYGMLTLKVFDETMRHHHYHSNEYD